METNESVPTTSSCYDNPDNLDSTSAQWEKLALDPDTSHVMVGPAFSLRAAAIKGATSRQKNFGSQTDPWLIRDREGSHVSTFSNLRFTIVEEQAPGLQTSWVFQFDSNSRVTKSIYRSSDVTFDAEFFNSEGVSVIERRSIGGFVRPCGNGKARLAGRMIENYIDLIEEITIRVLLSDRQRAC
jgi:hypothetical protein